jgi:hypothetical protein
MAICQYCKSVDVAWAWSKVWAKWVAFLPQRDAGGKVVTAPTKVDKAGRMANRPVADEALPHYPIPGATQAAIAGGAARGSWCAEWTPAKAVASQRTVKGSVGKKRAIGGPIELPGVPAGWTRGPASEGPAVDELYRAAAEVGRDLSKMTGGEDLSKVIGKIVSALPPTVPSWYTPMPEDAAVPLEAAPEVPAAPHVPKVEKLPTVASLMSKEARAAWARAAKAITCEVLPTRVLLWGPPGTGKTELPWRIAQERGWKHVYQLMTEETPGTELLGHLIVQGGSTVWCDGTLGRAIRESQTGHVVLTIDEVARASQDAMSACLLALTNPESLRLTLRSGEVLEPKPEHWHVVATSNDEPRVLPGALADRLHIAINVTHPHPDLVETLVTAEARRLVCAASREYSVRAVLTYDRLRKAGWTMEDAAGLVWEPEVAKSFQDAVAVGR